MPREILFTLPHTQLSARQWESNATDALPVFALHGWLDNAASFDEIAPQLENVSITALDLAGHGLSDHRPDGGFYHLWDYVLDLVSILQLQKQSVWLIGHSMGGAVAMLVAALAIDKVRGLVLLDNVGPLIDEAENRVSTMQRAVKKMLQYKKRNKSGYSSIETMIRARMNGFTKLDHAAATKLVMRGSVPQQDLWGWRHDEKLMFPSPFRMDEASVSAFIEKITCPTLLLVAKEGIYQQHPDVVDMRAKCFSWVKLKWLEGGHHFHLEQNTSVAVANEIKCFMDSN